jgi:hypothetical protein
MTPLTTAVRNTSVATSATRVQAKKQLLRNERSAIRTIQNPEEFILILNKNRTNLVIVADLDSQVEKSIKGPTQLSDSLKI